LKIRAFDLKLLFLLKYVSQILDFLDLLFLPFFVVVFNLRSFFWMSKVIWRGQPTLRKSPQLTYNKEEK
jgi:hypothetical protein